MRQADKRCEGKALHPEVVHELTEAELASICAGQGTEGLGAGLGGLESGLQALKGLGLNNLLGSLGGLGGGGLQ